MTEFDGETFAYRSQKVVPCHEKPSKIAFGGGENRGLRPRRRIVAAGLDLGDEEGPVVGAKRF